YRQEYGAFLVEGKKGVMDALLSGDVVSQLIMTEAFFQAHSEFCRQRTVQAFFDRQAVLFVTESVLAKIADTTTPPGIAAVVALPQHRIDALKNATTIAILEDIRDPGNLGTMIRTADWFGVDGLLLIGGADPYQPKVVRASMGSLFH